MKFIALKDFRNVPSLGLKFDDANQNHHIDKGETLELGQGKTLKECNAHDKQIIAQLVVSGCVGDAADEKVVAAVKAEIELDKRREAAAKKTAAESNNSALVAQLLEVLKTKGTATASTTAK